MVSMGMMGLFIGAIVLGIGYKLFEVWLGTGEASQPQAASAQPAGT
jgi:predicted PurR-regulated permease PerM